MSRRPDQKPEIQTPDPFGGIIESVMEKDRAWFEAHPGEASYTRACVHGEFWPLFFPWETSVTVTLIGPGARGRQTNRPPLNPEDGEGIAELPVEWLKKLRPGTDANS